MSGTHIPWHAADLVALDLEGSGGQDRDQEAILEIAAVPLVAGQPNMARAYSTLINPGRTSPMRPWISPGLTNQALRGTPPIADVEPELADRINGRILVGHNVGVDWRLLHRRCPTVAPVGFVDTLRLARTLDLVGGRSLTKLVDLLDLTDQVNAAALGSAPHRALWDTVAVGLLLGRLVQLRWPQPPTLAGLLRVAALPSVDADPADQQDALF
jgi:DNA polymerase-3 subunit epsilon